MCNIIIIDIRPVLEEYSKYIAFYNLYQRYPLPDIIQSLLTINQYEENQLPWLEMETRFDDVWDSLDFENIDFFYHNLITALDEFIRTRVPRDIDTSSYVFDRWLDSTSLALKKDPQYIIAD